MTVHVATVESLSSLSVSITLLFVSGSSVLILSVSLTFYSTCAFQATVVKSALNAFSALKASTSTRKSGLLFCNFSSHNIHLDLILSQETSF